MSADYWLEIDTGGKERAAVTEGVNCTYNLGPMLRAAGFPAWRALIGAPASEVGGMLRSVADRIRSDEAKYRAEYTPDNGWGSVEWALEFLDQFARDCAAHPAAFVGGWL